MAISDELDNLATPALLAAPRLLNYFKDLDEDALECEVAERSPKEHAPPPPLPSPVMPPPLPSSVIPPLPPMVPPPPPRSSVTPSKLAPTPRAPLRELRPHSANRLAGGWRTVGKATDGKGTCGKATGGKGTGGRAVPPSPAYSDLASPAPLEMSEITRALLGAGGATAGTLSGAAPGPRTLRMASLAAVGGGAGISANEMLFSVDSADGHQPSAPGCSSGGGGLSLVGGGTGGNCLGLCGFGLAGGRPSGGSELSRASVGSACSSVGGSSVSGGSLCGGGAAASTDMLGLKRFGLTGGPARRLISAGCAQRGSAGHRGSADAARLVRAADAAPPSAYVGSSRGHGAGRVAEAEDLEPPHASLPAGMQGLSLTTRSSATPDAERGGGASGDGAASGGAGAAGGVGAGGGDLLSIREGVDEEAPEETDARMSSAAAGLSLGGGHTGRGVSLGSVEMSPARSAQTPAQGGAGGGEVAAEGGVGPVRMLGGAAAGHGSPHARRAAAGSPPLSCPPEPASEATPTSAAEEVAARQAAAAGRGDAAATSIDDAAACAADFVTRHELAWWLLLPCLDSACLLQVVPAVCRKLRAMCDEVECTASVLASIGPRDGDGSTGSGLECGRELGGYDGGEAGGAMMSWSDIERAFPCGRSLAEGGCKKVFLVSETAGALEPASKNRSGGSGCCGGAEGGGASVVSYGGEAGAAPPRAMSVVDVRDLQAKGLEPSLRTEIWVTHLLSKLAALGRCPHYLQLHSCFRSASAPPAQWACTGGGGSPSAHSSAEQDENAPPPGRPRRTARKPARSAGRAGGCYQYVVMQYAEGGDMEEACKALPGMAWPVEQLPHLAFQMLFSLHVAQVELQLRHYDVKLLNFFLTSPAAAVGRPAPAVSGGAGCDEVPLCYSVLGADYLLRLDARSPSLAVLADFGTADISPRTLGAPVAACNFTTLENTPPEFLLCGDAARQGYEADAWGMALCMLHLLTGRAPYEELLAPVRCPADLRRSLEALWAGVESAGSAATGAAAACGGAGRGDHDAESRIGTGLVECESASVYEAVGQILETDEDGVLADTLYRYLCLFGPEAAGSDPLAPGQAAAAGREVVARELVPKGLSAAAASGGGTIGASPAWEAVERWLSSSSGRSRFGRDHAQWSAFHGRARPVAEAQRRMAQLPGAEEMLRGLCEFEPSRRWTVERALGSRMLEPLRDAAAEAHAEGRRPACCFTAYA